MPYVKTTWTNGSTALSANNMNKIENALKTAYDGVEGLALAILNIAHPIGDVIMSTTLDTAAKVSAAMGGGTWEAWGEGRVPVGVGTADGKTFAINQTGGQKDAVNVSHTHSVTGGGSGSTSSAGSHYHNPNAKVCFVVTDSTNVKSEVGGPISGNEYLYPKIDADYGEYFGNTSRTSSDGAHTHTIPNHTHTVSTAGESGTDKNLQPYVTCYMWRRTA